MASEHSSLAEPDRLAEVLFACLQAVEAGESPEDVRARYPEFAAEITEFLADRQRFEDLAAPLRAAVRATPTWPPAVDPTAGRAEGPPPAIEGRWIGDYELLEELGRGGMGVVYKARQKGLNRLVALKVIRSADLASPEELLRFRNEGEMLAALDHPHLVPVYEVGEFGDHLYLALKLIEGGGVDRRLASFREDPRAAARLAATAARAIHHAHQRGVLHRDLKPSNILLDAEGAPHVMDFGLAKRLQPGGEVTESGAILGTPAYMAPEQASGCKGAVTTATDVYDLGAVLYALLTGQPPFRGETVLETLEQVKTREPEPPRHGNPRVDRDLETICLKCLEKEPQQRYASAEAMGADLEHWLAGEPIQARSLGRAARIWRWCRRNPVVAALTAVTVVVSLTAVSALAVGAWFLWQERDAKAAALQQKEEALEQANARTQFAREAADEMYTEVAEGWLAHEPQQGSDLQRTFLRKALRFYQELAQERGMDPSVRHETAKAYVRVGRIEQSLGDFQEAEKGWRQALAIWEQLLVEFPADPAYRGALASTCDELTDLLQQMGKLRAAGQANLQALALREGLAREFPSQAEHRQGLARSHARRGLLLQRNGKWKEAETAFRQSIELVEGLAAKSPANLGPRSVLVDVSNHLGGLLSATGRFAEAERIYRQNLPHQEKLAKASPRDPDPRFHLALSRVNWGNALRSLGRNSEAEHAYQQALELFEKLVADYPKVARFRHELIRGYYNLALLLQNLSRLEAAEPLYRKVVDYFERLVAENPSVPDYQHELGGALNQLAGIMRAKREWAESGRLLERAIRYQRSALASNPRHPNYRLFLVNHYWGLADTLVYQGDHAGANQAVQELRRLSPERWQDYGNCVEVLARGARLAGQDRKLSAEQRRTTVQTYLKDAKGLLPEIHKRAKDDPEILNWLAWFLATQPEPQLRDPAQAVALAQQATKKKPQEGNYWNTLGVASCRAEDWRAAVKALEKSVELRKGGDSADWIFLAMAHWQLGDKAKARQWYDRGVQWMETNNPKDEELRRFRAEAAKLLGIQDQPTQKDKEGSPPKDK